MLVQLMFIFLFAINLYWLWLSTKSGNQPGKSLGQIFFVIIPLVMVFFPQPRFELDFFWWRIAGIAAVLVGLALIYWSTRVFRQASVALLDPAPKNLVTSGPYQFVRHPFYLGCVFVFVGWWWVFAAVYSFYFGLLIVLLLWLEARFEEALILNENFGRQFRDYYLRTGMFWIK